MEAAFTKLHITWLLMIMEHCSVSALQGLCWCICQFWTFFPSLTCILLLLPLRVRRMDESLQWNGILNLQFAICLSVSLFVYCMPACLSACCHCVYLLFLTVSVCSLFLLVYVQAFVLFYQQLVSLFANLCACLSEDMFPLVLSHLPDSIHTHQTLHLLAVIHSCHSSAEHALTCILHMINTSMFFFLFQRGI